MMIYRFETKENGVLIKQGDPVALDSEGFIFSVKEEKQMSDSVSFKNGCLTTEVEFDNGPSLWIKQNNGGVRLNSKTAVEIAKEILYRSGGLKRPWVKDFGQHVRHNDNGCEYIITMVPCGGGWFLVDTITGGSYSGIVTDELQTWDVWPMFTLVRDWL